MGYSIEANLKYGIKTAKDIKKNFDWITQCVSKLDFNITKIDFKANYHVGRIYCSAIDIQQVMSDSAFNEKFELVSFMVSFYDKNKCIGRFIYTRTLSVTSDDIITLQRLEECLDYNEITSKESTIVYNAPVINGDGNIVATDNANIISGESNTINNHSELPTKQQSKFKTFIKAVATNIISNFIYYLIGAAAVIIAIALNQ